jgi:hypothetical protein
MSGLGNLIRSSAKRRWETETPSLEYGNNTSFASSQIFKIKDRHSMTMAKK